MEKELILTKQEGNNFTFDGLPDTESNKVKQTLATESSAKEVLLKGDGASGADAYTYYDSGVTVYPTYGELSASIVEGSISMATKTDANLAVPERKGRNQEKLVDYFWLANTSPNLPTSYHSIIMTLTNQNKAAWTITQLCYPNKNGASTSEIHMRIGQSADSGSTITWSSWSSVGGGGSNYGADRGLTISNGNYGHSNTAVDAVTTDGLYKVKYDAYGHITGTAPVAKSDITALGIPSENTWRGVQNNLTSTSTTDSLSAAQGKALNDKFGSYLPLSGGTLMGNVVLGQDSTGRNAYIGAKPSTALIAYKRNSVPNCTDGSVFGTNDAPSYLRSSGDTLYHYDGATNYKILDEHNFLNSSAYHVDLTSKSTSMLTEITGIVKSTFADTPKFTIFECRSDGGAANITERPVSDTGSSFVCLCLLSRYVSSTDYIIKASFYHKSNKLPYYASINKNTTTISWSTVSENTHSHGNIANGGTLTNETTIASTDRIVLTDASDSYKIISDDQNAVANSLLNSLSTGASDPADADYYISQYSGGGTTTTTYHRRPMSKLWNYIKSKIGTYITGGTQTTTSTASGGSNVYTFYKSDGTTSTLTVKNGTNGTNATTTSVATSSANGLCPKLPTESSTTSFLRGDGTWATPTDNNNKVTQNVSTTGMTKVLLSYNTAAYNSNITDGATNTVKYSNNISASPGYGELYASGFSGSTFAGVAASADEAVPNKHTRNQSHLCNTYWVQYTSSANLPTSYHSIIQTYTYQSGANWVVTQLCYPHKAGATYTKMHIRGGSSTDSGSTFTWTSWAETYVDENVKQLKNSGSTWRSLLLGVGELGTNGTTAVADATGSTLCASNIMAKPSTGSLHANIYQSGTSSTGWYIGKLTADTTTSATYGPSGSLNLGYGGTDTAKRVVFSTNGDVVASGGASFKGSVGVGRTHSATAQSGGCLMTYNSSTDSLDFTFPSV